MKFTQFLALSEAAKFVTLETTVQSEKAIKEIISIMLGHGYQKKTDKSLTLTKYIFTKDKREITIDELWGENKGILNLYDTQFSKNVDFSDFVWDLKSNESHAQNIKAIISYLKKIV
jgi:hypothetical protein